MATKDMEGFGCSTAFSDFATYGRFTFSGSGSPTIQVGAAPYGDNALRNGLAGEKVGRVIPGAPYTSWFFGMRCRTNQSSATNNIISFRDSLGVNQLCIILDSLNDAVTVAQGFGTGVGTTLGSSAAGSLVASQFNYIEVGAVMAGGSSGSCVIKVNGATVLSLSGVNTIGSANANTTTWTTQTNGLTGNGMDIAHYYFNDTSGSSPNNSYLGDVRVQTVFPNGNSAVQFTPNGLGSNYLNAAKMPPVPGTDYNSDATAGHIDLFTTAGVDTDLPTVYSVKVNALLAKGDAGARTMATVLKSSATTQAGTTVSPSVSPIYYSDIYDKDPATAAAWLQAAASAALPGYKIVA